MEQRYSHVLFEGRRTPLAARASLRLQGERHNANSSRAVAEMVRQRMHEPELAAGKRALLHDILRRSGVMPAGYRMSGLARRLPACLRALGVENEHEAAVRLAMHPTCWETALNALLLGVTEFFRDGQPYEQLRKTILPGLLQGRAGLRVLSAACSDGAELYSLGICLGEQEVLGTSELVGVDCRQKALATAAAGWYHKTIEGSVPAELREQYLRPANGGYRMWEGLTGRAKWRMGDMCNYRMAGRYDLIACRNLAIYLLPGAADRLWRRLYEGLRPGGILFVGKAERPVGAFDRVGPCLYKKV